jgi:hypothetical protein
LTDRVKRHDLTDPPSKLEDLVDTRKGNIGMPFVRVEALNHVSASNMTREVPYL